MTANAADPKKVEAARLREAFSDRSFFADLREVLALPAGRRILWWVLEEAGIYRSSFTGNNTTFYNEGMRQVGLLLLGKIVEAKPEAMIQMMTEAKKREENDERSS